MERESLCIKMGAHMKETLRMISNQGRARLNTRMAMYMRENGRMDKCMERARRHQLVELYSQAPGSRDMLFTGLASTQTGRNISVK